MLFVPLTAIQYLYLYNYNNNNNYYYYYYYYYVLCVNAVKSENSFPANAFSEKIFRKEETFLSG